MRQLIAILCLLVMGCASAHAEYNIQIRRDTATRWTSFNPVLKAGEMGCEQDAGSPYNCGAIKVGNGVTPWSSLEYLIKRPATFRGALVYNSPGSTDPAPYVLTWGSESYDTDNIHSTSTNTSRLTVPSGVTKIRLKAHLYGPNAAATGSTTFTAWFAKNVGGSGFIGMAQTAIDAAAQPQWIAIETPAITVQAGDYFEVYGYGLLGDATGLKSWFAMEIIE